MNISDYIDHTNLKKDAKVEDIIKLCESAKKYHFCTVCVPPYYVKACKEYLKDTTIQVCTVIGFPNGYSTKEVKSYEAIDAINNGADEIDMVININALKNKDYDYVKEEIETIRDSIDGKVLKVIIETCLLDDEEVIKMTKICNETFVNFIKTSTGFDKQGYDKHTLELIMKNKNSVLEVKASGGIKTEKDAYELIEMGCTRLGTSHSVEIMEGEDNMSCCCHEEKHCDCDSTCTCGCQEGKECTCNGNCNCSEDCTCGCQEGKECTCGEKHSKKTCKCHNK